jgi:hypothetical protein
MYGLFNFIRRGSDDMSPNGKVIGEISVRYGLKQLFSNLR